MPTLSDRIPAVIDGVQVETSRERLADLDPRDPDYSRAGIFQNHNCYRCKHGARPCVQGSASRCEYPHARND